MKICFVDNTKFNYDSSYKHTNNLRGAESVLINLSNSLKDLGNDITVINNCPNSKVINDISWININKSFELNDYDLVISNGDCNNFKFANGKKNILLSHSNQPIEQFLRKKQLFSYLKYKPKICFSSKFHQKKRSKLISLFGDIFLPWSVDEMFINTKISPTVNNSQAIFTSRPERNQNLLIDIWSKSIFKRNNNLKLLIYGSTNYENKNGIKNINFVNQNDLINDLKNSRVFLIPGHRAETFCLAAEEAKELCVPLVTLGIGCLPERVDHGKTGYIAKNINEFVNYTIKLFNNDDTWSNFRNNLIKNRGKYNWSMVAKKLIENFK